MKKRSIVMMIELAAAILLVLLDQGTKIAAAAALKGQAPLELIPGVLELYYLENTGAAFSMLENAQWFFVIVAVAAIAVIVWFLWKIPASRRFAPLHVLLVLIASGAAGNLIDRIQLHYVRDFIYFSIINFPVFNVADIYVTMSTIILVILILFHYKEEDFKAIRG